MIPLLAASEKGREQTESFLKKNRDVVLVYLQLLNRSWLESYTLKGDSPVDVDSMA